MKNLFLLLTFLISCSIVSFAADKCLIENSFLGSVFYPLPVDEGNGLIAKEFKTQSGKTLFMDLNSGGEIEISGWDKEQVSVEFHFKRRDSDRYNVEFEETSDGINVMSDFKEEEEHRNTNLKVKVSVPKKYNLDILTKGGAISIQNVEGDLKGKTMGGGIELSSLKGNIDFKTYGGEVNLTKSEVDGKVETMGGTIELEDVKGDVSSSTMGGNVKYNRITNNNTELHLSTMGGNIELDNAANGAEISTLGGNIELGTAAKYVKVSTMGGNISIREIDGSLEASTMSGDIDAKVKENKFTGEKEIELESMNGDITLFVPDNFSMEVSLEVSGTYRKNRIENDFDMTNTKTRSDHDSVYMKGEHNGGKNKIRIKTVNGKIFLRKA